MTSMYCRCCGADREIRARGLCRSCYSRWVRDGKPEEGPGPPVILKGLYSQPGCSSCGAERERVAHGWCKACYARWIRAGKPAGGPPPPSYDRDLAGHLEEYLFMRETCRIRNREELARRIGVSPGSVSRYGRLVREAS